MKKMKLATNKEMLFIIEKTLKKETGNWSFYNAGSDYSLHPV